MQAQKKCIKTIYFVFKPSLSILDGWLPILHRINEKDQNIRIIAVFPDPTIANLINDKNILLDISNDIFDYVLIKRFSKKWLKSDDLKSARENSKISNLERKLIFFYKAFKRRNYILLSKITWFIFTLFDWFRYLNVRNMYDISSINMKNAIVLYDMCKHYSSDSQDIQSAFENATRFSIFHGPIIREKSIPLIDNRRYPNTVAYLFSNKEKKFYKETYGLDEQQMRVVGVPRHDSKWIKIIIDYDNKLNKQIEWSDYIYLVGRALQWNISHDRKKKALEDLKELAFNVLDKKIIVKLHPKEKNSKYGDGLYYEIFGREAYGEKWIISDRHSFSLGINSIFTITLNSSVSTDMIVIGTPIIEYYNTDRLEGYDHNYSQMLKDKRGNPITEFNYYGFVLPASNYEDLLFQANRIMSDRSGVVKELQSNYHDNFHYDNNVINNIVSDIESDIRI